MSTITTTINHGITLGAPGYISPLTVTGAGAVNNGDTEPAIFGGTGTVVNYGKITETGSTAGVRYEGIYLTDNGSMVDNRGTITAGRNAIELHGTGDVVNSGSIYGALWGIEGLDFLTVTNTGTIAGDIQAINLFAGGLISNSGIISGEDGIGIHNATGTVVNNGTIASYGAAVAMDAGGTVSNTGTGLILASGLYAGIYIDGGAGSVVNTATITGYSGVMFSGTYNNTLIDSAVRNSGSIGGNATATLGAGVYLGAGGSVTNVASAAITGFLGVYGKAAATTVINAAAISGNSLSGNGILLAANGTVCNQLSGKISGFIGVYGKTTVATVVNAGSIGGNTSNGVGVALHAGGRITNLSTGTISGGADAVRFYSGFSNVLTAFPGASFIGTVDGGNTIGAASISTLALREGVNGTLTGVGTQFINFALTQIYSSADWTFAGAASLVAGATLNIDGPSTLAITGTLANSGTVTGGALMLIGGSLINQAGGLLTSTTVYGGGPSGTNSIANLGTIINSFVSGVYLQTGGTVTNLGTAALIEGYRVGVLITSEGTVITSGTIASSQRGPRCSGNIRRRRPCQAGGRPWRGVHRLRHRRRRRRHRRDGAGVQRQRRHRRDGAGVQRQRRHDFRPRWQHHQLHLSGVRPRSAVDGGRQYLGQRTGHAGHQWVRPR